MARFFKANSKNNMPVRVPFFVFILVLFSFFSPAQIKYPYPVKSISILLDGQELKMAYMDVSPLIPNGESVLLLHGKNFTGFYWKEVIDFLSKAGFRVVVPDQVGWGLSSKPSMKYSFEMLATNNKILLDSLKIGKINVIGHSMGGMLATRFALLYPERALRLILEDPLGLEDYKKFVPFKTIEQQYNQELGGNYAKFKKNQQSYYPVWKPEYEQYVKLQAGPLKQKDYNTVAYINALTYQMIYEQPVLYEFNKLRLPTLLIIGELDRTILGKEMLTKEQQQLHGNFPILGNKAKLMIKNSKLIVIAGVGHIPHIQTPSKFNKYLLSFLKNS